MSETIETSIELKIQAPLPNSIFLGITTITNDVCPSKLFKVNFVYINVHTV